MSPVPEELDPQNPNPDDSGAVRRYARGTGGRILWIVVVIILALGSGFIFVRHQKSMPRRSWPKRPRTGLARRR